jgi:protein arginine N-methyltransferase 1
MYSLESFGGMVADSVRMGAYEEALRRTVRPESVVLDIGAGTGIMSLIAAKLGARRVVAIEPNPLVRIGARLAVENRFGDRIRFIHGRSQQVVLEEKADVVVGDLRGGLPNTIAHVEALADARRRLLKPNGVLIPVRDTVFAAPVQAEEAYSKLVSPWRDNAFELEMAGAAEAILNQGLMRLEAVDCLLAEGRPIAALEYATAENASINAALELPILQAGVIHGLSLWFETELVPGVGFSTAPDKEKTVYGRMFLPVPEPVSVEEDDRMEVSIREVVEKETHLWIWKGRVIGKGRTKKASFASSSAFFNPETPAVNEVFHEGCAPRLSDDGQLVRTVLAGVDGRLSVAELTALVLAQHPERFEHHDDARNFVRDLLERYGDATLRIDG